MIFPKKQCLKRCGSKVDSLPYRQMGLWGLIFLIFPIKVYFRGKCMFWIDFDINELEKTFPKVCHLGKVFDNNRF